MPRQRILIWNCHLPVVISYKRMHPPPLPCMHCAFEGKDTPSGLRALRHITQIRNENRCNHARNNSTKVVRSLSLTIMIKALATCTLLWLWCLSKENMQESIHLLHHFCLDVTLPSRKHPGTAGRRKTYSNNILLCFCKIWEGIPAITAFESLGASVCASLKANGRITGAATNVSHSCIEWEASTFYVGTLLSTILLCRRQFKELTSRDLVSRVRFLIWSS
jgi:hypothetical protein